MYYTKIISVVFDTFRVNTRKRSRYLTNRFKSSLNIKCTWISCLQFITERTNLRLSFDPLYISLKMSKSNVKRKRSNHISRTWLWTSIQKYLIHWRSVDRHVNIRCNLTLIIHVISESVYETHMKKSSSQLSNEEKSVRRYSQKGSYDPQSSVRQSSIQTQALSVLRQIVYEEKRKISSIYRQFLINTVAEN